MGDTNNGWSDFNKKMRELQRELQRERQRALHKSLKSYISRARYFHVPVMRRSSTGSLRFDIATAPTPTLPEEYEYVLLEQGSVTDEHIACLARAGWTVIKDRYIVSPETTAFLDSMFGLAIDFRSYAGGLLARTLARHEGVEAVVSTAKNAKGKPCGSDGHMRAHPSSPVWSTPGVTGQQFRAYGQPNAEGFRPFAKGLMVMDPTLPVGEVHVDPSCLKGRLKKSLPEGTKLLLDFGIIADNEKHGSQALCFEVVENIRNSEAKQVLRELVDEFFEQNSIEERVMDTLMSDNELLARQVQAALSFEGCQSRLGAFVLVGASGILSHAVTRKQYKVANGGYFESPTRYSVMDNTVPKGCVVTDPATPGDTIALYRTPMVLRQGIATYRVVKPSAHHVSGVIYMNPEDCGLLHQGDDDGDKFVIITDSRLVDLFRTSYVRRKMAIEPDKVKLSMDSATPEGRAYIANGDMSPLVGQGTILRSRFLLSGDEKMANCLSVTVQEAIDSEKSTVRFTKPDAVMWEERNGVLYPMSGLGFDDRREFEQWFGEWSDGLELPPLRWRRSDRKANQEWFDGLRRHRGSGDLQTSIAAYAASKMEALQLSLEGESRHPFATAKANAGNVDWVKLRPDWEGLKSLMSAIADGATLTSLMAGNASSWKKSFGGIAFIDSAGKLRFRRNADKQAAALRSSINRRVEENLQKVLENISSRSAAEVVQGCFALPTTTAWAIVASHQRTIDAYKLNIESMTCDELKLEVIETDELLIEDKLALPHACDANGAPMIVAQCECCSKKVIDHHVGLVRNDKEPKDLALAVMAASK